MHFIILIFFQDVHLSLGEKLVWTCAWNRWNERVSLGVRGSAQIIDISRRNKWVYNTCGGDPVTQMFSKKVRNYLVSQLNHKFMSYFFLDVTL